MAYVCKWLNPTGPWYVFVFYSFNEFINIWYPSNWVANDENKSQQISESTDLIYDQKIIDQIRALITQIREEITY